MEVGAEGWPSLSRQPRPSPPMRRQPRADDPLLGWLRLSLASSSRPRSSCEYWGLMNCYYESLQVDEYSRTSVDSIWAVGDVTDRINLTPVALIGLQTGLETGPIKYLLWSKEVRQSPPLQSHSFCRLKIILRRTWRNKAGSVFEPECLNRRGEVVVPNLAFWGVSHDGRVETEQTLLEVHLFIRLPAVFATNGTAKRQTK
ncbi:hypothetical protein KSP40_PGU000232 [Platanthera guangdongensis]|uniref:FAD/NAD(P)-binding domain-containing protein n=1 Tax=Platanthera guangdongensis TaxID=2320717 RepID=A0ABR2MIV0_9ASPA